MNREEEIRALAVGEGRALLQWNEVVGTAGEDDFDAGDFLQEVLEAQRHVEDELGLGDAFAFRAGVVSAVAGVDHNPRHAETELTSDGESAGEILRGRDGRRRRIRRFQGGDSGSGRVVRQKRLAEGVTCERRHGRQMASPVGHEKPRRKTLERGLLATDGRRDRSCPDNSGRHCADAIDDETVRAVKRIQRVARHANGIENDARRIIRVTADADLPYDVAIPVEAQRLIAQRRGRTRGRKIDEHTRGTVQPFLVKQHFTVELDGDADRVGQHRTTDAFDDRDLSGRGNRRGCSFWRAGPDHHALLQIALERRLAGVRESRGCRHVESF